MSRTWNPSEAPYEERLLAAKAYIGSPGNLGIRTSTLTAAYVARRNKAIEKGKQMDADRDRRYQQWVDAGAPHQVAFNAAERGMDIPIDFLGKPGSKRHKQLELC